MRPPLRIAVLEAGYPADDTAAQYGSYGGVFSSLLKAGVKALGIPGFSVEEGLNITKWDVQKAELYPSLEDVDAILITGSQSNAFDNTPWITKLVEFTRKTLAEQTRVRVIGVCFGHQIVGRVLGAKVDRNEHGWEASVVPMHLSPKGKKLFGGKDVLSGNVKRQDMIMLEDARGWGSWVSRVYTNIHQMHRDVITELPAGTELLGSTSMCKIHGMYASKRLFTIQGHPEFTSEILSELLVLRKKIGIFPEDIFDEMMSRANNKHDGIAVAIAFLKFLNE